MTTRYLLRRLSFMFFVILFAMTVNFTLPRLLPGDIIDLMLGDVRIDPETRGVMMRRFGLDQPVWTQFWLYIRNTLTGEFGTSFANFPSSVLTLIKRALPWTLALLWCSTLVTVPLAYILGTLAGWRAGSKRDSTIQGVSLALLATPTFWIAMLFLFVFGFTARWFPLSGALTAGYQHVNAFDWLADWLHHAFLPILSLAVHFGASQLIMRNTMVTTLRSQYVLTAQAKGLSDNAVKFRHASRNALLPMITGVVLRFTMVIAGSIYIETVFSYPGMGRLMFGAISTNDYPVIQGCFFILSLVSVCTVFLIDLVYLRLDPRIRF